MKIYRGLEYSLKIKKVIIAVVTLGILFYC